MWNHAFKQIIRSREIRSERCFLDHLDVRSFPRHHWKWDKSFIIIIIVIIIIAINGIDVGILWVYIIEENFSNRWNAQSHITHSLLFPRSFSLSLVITFAHI